MPVKFQRKDYWALSAEDLIVMKLLANRAKDVDDVAGVLEKMFGELDWLYPMDGAKTPAFRPGMSAALFRPDVF